MSDISLINSKSISEMFKNSNDKQVSVELCSNLNVSYDLLSKLNVKFYSVTWHMESPSMLDNIDKIPAIVLAEKLCSRGYNVLLHITGKNLNKTNALEILNLIKNIGVKNLFVLQGDSSQVVKRKDGKYDFPFAVDFVRFIRSNFQNYFTIGVAGYPEKHVEATSFESDILYLKEKASYADFIVTQICFNYEILHKFVQTCRKNCINIPIIPGTFLIKSTKFLLQISNICGITIPKEILSFIDENGGNEEKMKEFGINYAATFVKKIFKEDDFKWVHIFSLNDLHSVQEIFEKINAE